ncbi:hypothetical protein [Azospirillum argentinense]|uniref:hypothetical protein n=1 Tax=Azospirillum argentinense TaxID=2970906 RepID=UPI0032DEF7FC
MAREMIPYGTFPTPYGVSVDVFQPEVPDPRDPEAVMFTAEATAICAGIHDPKERERFVADARRTGDVPLFKASEYGGFIPLLRIPLSRPAEPFYPQVPTEGPAAADGASCREIVDRWIDVVTLHHRWCDRAEELLKLSIHQVEGLGKQVPRGAPSIITGLPLSMMITAVLENLGDEEIDCLEAAAFYTLSMHDRWRKAGQDWLYPVRETWFADWIKARQGYRRVAKIMVDLHDDLPRWLCGRAS